MDAFDEIEARLPQNSSFEASTTGFISATKLPIQDDYRSPSPDDPPPEPDVDAWFNPAPVEALPLFTTAKSIDKADAYRPKAFRSPLLKSVHTSKGVQLPHPLSASVNVSPSSASTPQTGFASPSFMSPLRSSVPQSGFPSPSSFMTPLRSNVQSGMSRTRPAPFVTPFKPGMRPGDPGRSKQGQSSVATTSPLALKAAVKKEPSQKGLSRDRPACVLKRKGFFSLGRCTTLFSLMSLTFCGWKKPLAQTDRH